MNGSPAFDVDALLAMRRHLSIVHHLPGRIRLRLGPALWGGGPRLERDRFQRLLDGLEGIHDVRLNKAVASVVIEYDPGHVSPQDWETLLRGETEAAGRLLEQWLDRHGQLLHATLTRKE